MVGVELVLLIVGTSIASLAAVLHMLGWIPPRYRRVLAEIQAKTADSLGGVMRSEVGYLATQLQNASETHANAFLARLDASDVSKGLAAVGTHLQALPVAVEAFERLPQALAEGLQAGLTYLGRADWGKAGLQAANESASAKVGARRFLASLAAQVHPVAGAAVGVASAVGLLDDATAEQIATFFLENPEVMAKINAAGQRLAEQRGIVGSVGGIGALRR